MGLSIAHENSRMEIISKPLKGNFLGNELEKSIMLEARTYASMLKELSQKNYNTVYKKLDLEEPISSIESTPEEVKLEEVVLEDPLAKAIVDSAPVELVTEEPAKEVETAEEKINYGEGFVTAESVARMFSKHYIEKETIEVNDKKTTQYKEEGNTPIKISDIYLKNIDKNKDKVLDGLEKEKVNTLIPEIVPNNSEKVDLPIVEEKSFANDEALERARITEAEDFKISDVDSEPKTEQQIQKTNMEVSNSEIELKPEVSNSEVEMKSEVSKTGFNDKGYEKLNVEKIGIAFSPADNTPNQIKIPESKLPRVQVENLLEHYAM